MMVAAIIGGRQASLAINRAAEFAAPDHQRVVQHAALLQIRSPARPKPDPHPCSASADSAGSSAVMVPIAMVKLDEPHPALRQPARQQTIRRERAGLLRVLPIELESARPVLSKGRSVRAPTSASGTPSHIARCGRRFPDRRIRLSAALFSSPSASRNVRRFFGENPGGFERYSTGSAPRPELHALIAAGQKRAAPQAVVQRLAAAGLVEIMTQKAGRSSVSLPSP